jgi:hypothetical protein
MRQQGAAAAIAVALMLVLTPLITVATSLPPGLAAAPGRFQLEGAIATALPPAVLGLAILVYVPGRAQGRAWRWVVGVVASLLVLAILPLLADFVLNGIQLRSEVPSGLRGNVTRALVRGVSAYAVVICATVLLAREALGAARSLSRRARRLSQKQSLVYRSPVLDGQSAEV